MLLQLLNPEMNNAVYPALPVADDCPSAIIAPDKTVIQQGIFSTHYPKTIQLMNLLEPGFTEQLHVEDLREFEEKINQKINLLSASEGWEIMEVFKFERTRSSCWKIHKGHLCYAKKNEFISNQNKQLLFSTDDMLLDLNVALADHVRFYPIASRLRTIMELKQSDCAALFISEESGLQTIYIGQLPALILSHLHKEVTSGRKLIDFIMDDFLQEDSWTMEHEALKQRLLLQIRSLIRNGIISVKV